MWSFLFLVGVVAFCSDHTQAICGNTPVVWRNNNFTCPVNAVCADVFKTVRDWYNGTSCQEERVLHHCLCGDGTVCPYTSDSHLLYASAQHMQYTCQPKCNLPYCSSMPQRNIDGRVYPRVAQRLEQNAAEFNGRNYYRMECRCPRHHLPVTQTPGVHRSVQAHSHTYDTVRHRYSTIFVCTVAGNQNVPADPCPSQSNRSQVNSQL